MIDAHLPTRENDATAVFTQLMVPWKRSTGKTPRCQRLTENVGKKYTRHLGILLGRQINSLYTYAVWGIVGKQLAFFGRHIRWQEKLPLSPPGGGGRMVNSFPGLGWCLGDSLCTLHKPMNDRLHVYIFGFCTCISQKCPLPWPHGVSIIFIRIWRTFHFLKVKR